MSSSRPASLLVIFVTVFIDLLGFGIVLPLLPRYGEAFQADHFQLGLLMSSFSAMQFLFAPVWGRVSDRVGRRPILMLGLAGSTGSYALFGYASSLTDGATLLGLSALPWLFITRIGAGIAGATIPTAQAYIADITGRKERAKGMALIGAAFGIGFTFGPLLGAAFVSGEPGAPPSSAPGYVAAVLSGVALLMAVFVLPESLRPDSTPAGAHWLDMDSLKRATGRPVALMILLTIFLTTFAFAQFESTLSLLTKALGMAQRDNFLIFAYIGLVLTISQGVLVRRLVPRLGEYRMSLVGVVLMTLGLALIGLAGLQGSSGLLLAVLPVSVVGHYAVTAVHAVAVQPGIRAGRHPRSGAEHVGPGPHSRPGGRHGTARAGSHLALLVRSIADGNRSAAGRLAGQAGSPRACGRFHRARERFGSSHRRFTRLRRVDSGPVQPQRFRLQPVQFLAGHAPSIRYTPRAR